MTNNIDIETLAVKFGIDYTEEFGKVLKQLCEAYAAEKQRQQEPVAKIKDKQDETTKATQVIC